MMQTLERTLTMPNPQPNPSEVPDPKKTRTRAATLANMRSREEKYAALLVERGWTVISPYDGSVRAPKEDDEA